MKHTRGKRTPYKFSEKTGRGAKKDHAGIEYGWLTCLNFSRTHKRRTLWVCRCRCGNVKEVRIDAVLRGMIVSCGCAPTSTITDISGKRIGRLVVVRYSHKKNKSHYWVCKCDCGNEVIVPANNIGASNKTKSCGCLHREKSAVQAKLMGDANATHSMTGSPEYNVWKSMKARCLSETATGYDRYGKVGVIICSGLMDFSDFYKILGVRPSMRHTLDRTDPHGNYTCGNCDDCSTNLWVMNVRWVDDKTQQRNRRVHRRLTLNGVTRTLSEWAEAIGIHIVSLWGRLRLGWPTELALTLPPGSRPDLPLVRERDIPDSIINRCEAVQAVNTFYKSRPHLKPAHCEHDGCTTAKIEGHHHLGYEPEHWMDVIWLCKKHHEEAEKLMGKSI